jgi:hypothetical protein
VDAPVAVSTQTPVSLTDHAEGTPPARAFLQRLSFRPSGRRGKDRNVRRNRAWFVSAGALLLATVPAVALAADPVRGAAYKGSLTGASSSIRISFRVSPGGSQVQAIRLSALPIFCAGGAPPNSTLEFANARVTAAGTFSAAGRDVLGVGPLKGTVAAKLVVTGTFAANGRESGTVTTTFSGSAKHCGGRARYRTRSSGN